MEVFYPETQTWLFIPVAVLSVCYLRQNEQQFLPRNVQLPPGLQCHGSSTLKFRMHCCQTREVRSAVESRKAHGQIGEQKTPTNDLK